MMWQTSVNSQRGVLRGEATLSINRQVICRDGKRSDLGKRRD
jgi:hypothetical protein